jgi:hypothetical protein
MGLSVTLGADGFARLLTDASCSVSGGGDRRALTLPLSSLLTE